MKVDSVPDRGVDTRFPLGWWILWGGVLAIVAFVAIGLQMDRQSRSDESLASTIPEPFRGEALEGLARQAYGRDDIEGGIAFSRQLVRRRPVPADGLALLTLGYLKAGDQENAVSALILGAQRGWRNTYTQVLMAGSALEVGDAETASQRVLSLWRQGKDIPERKLLTKALLLENGGLEPFSALISEDDSWATSFLVWGIKDGFADAILETTASRFAETGVDIYCEQLSWPIKELVAQGRSLLATNLWSRLCADGARKNMDDFSFNALSARGPFDWGYPRPYGMRVNLLDRDGERVLEYTNSDPMRLIVAERLIAMEPGTHSVRLVADIEDGRPQLRLRCVGSEDNAIQLAGSALDEDGIEFVVSPSCRAQRIDIIAGKGRGTIRQVLID